MSEFPRPPGAPTPHEVEHHHGAEPAPLSLWDDAFYDSKQTAWLLGSMGLGFVVLVAILLVVGS